MNGREMSLQTEEVCLGEGERGARKGGRLTVEHNFSRFARGDTLVRRAGGHSRLLRRVAFIQSFRVDLDDVERP